MCNNTKSKNIKIEVGSHEYEAIIPKNSVYQDFDINRLHELAYQNPNKFIIATIPREIIVYKITTEEVKEEI